MSKYHRIFYRPHDMIHLPVLPLWKKSGRYESMGLTQTHDKIRTQGIYGTCRTKLGFMGQKTDQDYFWQDILTNQDLMNLQELE